MLHFYFNRTLLFYSLSLLRRTHFTYFHCHITCAPAFVSLYASFILLTLPLSIFLVTNYKLFLTPLSTVQEIVSQDSLNNSIQ
uniref:Uncharacterized protein n=1 Tax=Octopus bimaculoides TaxID=37653 RepID=A0A0L8HWV7_OCTBM